MPIRPISLMGVFNDTDTQVDYSKMKFSELSDTRDGIQTKLDAIENKYDEGDFGWNAEDAEEYKQLLESQDALLNAMESHPERLMQRRQSAGVPEQLNALSDGLQVLSDRIRVIGPVAESDPSGRFGYNSDNEFLQEVAEAYVSGKPSDRLNTVLNAVGDDEYAAGSWKAAGVFIPKGFMNTIIRTAPEDDQLLGRLTEIPLNVPEMSIPAMVDKDHSTSFTGGTRVWRTGETLTVDKTKDQFEKVEMSATELVGEAAVTKTMLRFSTISIPALIQSSMQLAMSYKRRDEILVGDGRGQYLGAINSSNPALKTIQRKSGQNTADIINGENILEMRKSVWDYDNAVWVFNWDLFEEIAQLHIESDNNAGLVKVYSPPQGDVPESILGRPVVWTEFMPGIETGTGAVHTNWGDSEFGNIFAGCFNMSAYYRGLVYTDNAVSSHVRFSEREEVFQFVMMDDARPSWLAHLTPKRGSTTRAPLVGLTSTPAS